MIGSRQILSPAAVAEVARRGDRFLFTDGTAEPSPRFRRKVARWKRRNNVGAFVNATRSALHLEIVTEHGPAIVRLQFDEPLTLLKCD
jgi:hypothetical protein